MFAQLGAIARTNNKFLEIAAIAEHYLIITHVKNKESEKQLFQMSLPVIICCWKNTNKLGKKNFPPNLQYFQLEQK